MVPLIGQLLRFGYSAQVILGFLGANVPNLQKGIQSAQKAGYAADKILNFLSQNISPKNKQQYKDTLSANEKYFSSIGLKTKQERDQRRNKLLKGALGVGAGFLAGRELGMLQGQQARGMQQPQGPQNPPQLPPPPAPPQGIAPTPTPMNPIGPAAAQPPGPPNAPTGPNPRQGPMAQTPQPNLGVAAQAQQPQSIPQKPDAATTLDMLGIREKLERLRIEGKPPQMIKAIAEKMIKPEQKAELDALNQPGQPSFLSQVLDDFLKQPPTMVKTNLPPGQENKLPDWLEGSETYQPKEANVKPIDKGSDVILPDGIGKVVANNGKELLVEKDGKVSKHDPDSVIDSPLPEKDLASLYDDLLRGVEKETGEEVSRMVNWSGYDPTTNTLAFLPHDGGLYIYDNISPEDAKELTSYLTNRKTTGENFIGAWQQGTKSPIGAPLSALIRKIQKERGGKGKEYSAKFDTVYAYLEPAIKAKKARKKEQDEKERSLKKKAKKK